MVGEEAVDGTDRGQRPDVLLCQALANGLGPARHPPVIEMQPFQDNQVFDFDGEERGHRPSGKAPGRRNG